MASPPRTAASGPAVRFRPPAPKLGGLRRPRVSAAIDDALDGRAFSIVSAPSGYGKTTAVADWGAGVECLAWLTLNGADADPTHLARGVLDALDTMAEARGVTLRLPKTRSTPERAYAAICDALGQWDGAIHLVVDEAHRAGEHWRDGVLGMLTAQPPDNLRIVLVGTTLLDITSSRERLTEPGAFVGADPLRFTESEVEELKAAGTVSLDSATILEETQGWPIAVRMVVIAGARPSSGASSATEFLTDYVRDHVLGAVDPDIAEFVLTASVCRETDARLAAAVTGRADAGQMLEDCVRLGLFLDRFTGTQGIVYRWHGSFSRTCREIRGLDPARDAAAHLRAAAYLADINPMDSIAHSLRGSDAAQGRTTLLRHWLTLLMSGSAAEVEAQCTQLLRHAPSDAEVLLVRACATDLLDDHHMAVEQLSRAEALCARPGTEAGALLLDTARLLIADDREQVAAARSRVQDRLARLDVGAVLDHAAMSQLLGWSEIRHPSNPLLPAEYFASAAREFRSWADSEQSIRAAGHLAFGQMWAGHIGEARRVLSEIEEEIGERTPANGYAIGTAAAAAGFVAYWTGDSAGAARRFDAIVHSGSSDQTAASVARMMIAYAAADSGDLAMCRRAAIGIQEIPIDTRHGVPWGVCRESSIAMLEEAIGNQERALRLARKHAQWPDLPVISVALAGVLRRAGEHGEALAMLRSLRVFADVSYVKAATLITAATMRRHQGDHAGAHDLCEAALAVASREDLRVLFGPRETGVRRLLSEHVHFGTQFEDFISRCLSSEAVGSVMAALSDRERDVFQQLQTSRTLPEIAEELGVSINTVKTHQRSIYRKLDVSSRREAVRAVV